MNIQGLHPTIMAPIQAQSASGSSSPMNSGSSATSASDLQSTFLNLLVTELQNQDPTSPVDPTAMVTQMVSLNQLDQLISINQTLGNLASGTSSTPSSQPSSTKTVATQVQAKAQLSSKPLPGNWVSMQDPAVPATAPGAAGMMNLYGSPSMPFTNSNVNQTGAR
jgi:flagellar basal-body rod modification protein FlgD